MQTLPAKPIEENRALRSMGLNAYPSSSGDVLGATAEEAWATNPIPSLWQMMPTLEADKILSPEEANARYGIDKELQFDAPVQETDAQDYNKSKREELARRDIFQRSQGGGLLGAAQFGVGLAVSMVDPLNIASAFIPVVGPARYAVMIEKAGGAAGRAGIRTAVGAAEGLVGAAVVEPLIYGAATQRQADYDATDSLLNLAFGTVLGGGLHSGLGALGDTIRAKKLDEPLLRESVASVIEDRPVSVEAQLRASLAESTGIEGILRQSGDVVPGVVDAPAMPRAVDMAQGQLGGVPTRQADIASKPGDIEYAANKSAIRAIKEGRDKRGDQDGLNRIVHDVSADANINELDARVAVYQRTREILDAQKDIDVLGEVSPEQKKSVDTEAAIKVGGDKLVRTVTSEMRRYEGKKRAALGSEIDYANVISDHNVRMRDIAKSFGFDYESNTSVDFFTEVARDFDINMKPGKQVERALENARRWLSMRAPKAFQSLESGRINEDAFADINKQFSEAYAPGIKSWEAPEVRAIDELLSGAPMVDLDAARVQSEIADFEAIVGALDEGEAAFIKEADDMGNFADQFAVAAQAVARCRVGKA